MSTAPRSRPPFIISSHDVVETPGSYTGTDEVFSYARAIGRAAGLQRLGLHLVRVPPGQRTSLPHAEEDEEEFVVVLEGEVDAWIDGDLHPMRAGDLTAFPPEANVRDPLGARRPPPNPPAPRPRSACAGPGCAPIG